MEFDDVTKTIEHECPEFRIRVVVLRDTEAVKLEYGTVLEELQISSADLVCVDVSFGQEGDLVTEVGPGPYLKLTVLKQR